MDHYLPEISWHDRKALLSIDINPVMKGNKYKIVTSSMQKEVRIWEFEFEKCPENPQKIEAEELSVTFMANLNGHNAAVNCVKFGHVEPGNLLATGDSDGRISIWQLTDQPVTVQPTALGSDDNEIPPNKENWIRTKVLNHDEDVAALCFSPDCKFLASVSRDNSLLVHDPISGKRILSLRNFRQFPNGISWDPLGKYIMTMSTDRRMDLIDAAKGTKLRTWMMTDLPAAMICGLSMDEKPYRLFHDDQLASFQRGVAFSPCGQLIVAPAGHLEIGTDDVFGSYVFLRQNLDKDRPLCFLPSGKVATFVIKMCPVLFELGSKKTNYSGLPYRILWLALTKDSVIFYDSQHSQAIGFVDNIHYNNLTDATWSADGKNVIVASLEGYCSFLKLNLEAWGCTVEKEALPAPPPSPQLIQVRKRKPKEKKEVKIEEGAPESLTPVPDTPSQIVVAPRTPKSLKPSTPIGKGAGTGSAPGTPKSANLKKFFLPKLDDSKSLTKVKSTLTPEKKDGMMDTSETTTSTATPLADPMEASPIEVRKKKRVTLITLTD